LAVSVLQHCVELPTDFPSWTKRWETTGPALVAASCRPWGRISLNKHSGIVSDESPRFFTSKILLGFSKGGWELRYVHRIGEEEDSRSQALVQIDYHRRYKPRSTRPTSVMQAIWYLHSRFTGFKVGHASIAASSALLTPWILGIDGFTDRLNRSLFRDALKDPKGRLARAAPRDLITSLAPLRLTLEPAYSSRSGLKDPIIRLEAGWVGWRRAAHLTPGTATVASMYQRTVAVSVDDMRNWDTNGLRVEIAVQQGIPKLVSKRSERS
jgi:hypothetical protein